MNTGERALNANTSHMSSRWLIEQARRDAQAVAEGPFTPVVFERYEWIGHAPGWRVGYPTTTVDGHCCIVWKH
jgi:hypothetical protein